MQAVSQSEPQPGFPADHDRQLCASCSFMIGLWGLKLGFGDSIAGMPTDVDRLDHRRALCPGRRRRRAVIFRRRRRIGRLCLQRNAGRQADRPQCARRHDRQDRRGGRGDDQERRAGLPHRHRHRPFQAHQRFDRLQPGRRADPRLRQPPARQPAGKCRHRPHRRRRVRGALSGRHRRQSRWTGSSRS